MDTMLRPDNMPACCSRGLGVLRLGWALRNLSGHCLPVWHACWQPQATALLLCSTPYLLYVQGEVLSEDVCACRVFRNRAHAAEDGRQRPRRPAQRPC